MKKLFIILVALISMFSLVACSNQGAGNNASGGGNSTPPQTEEERKITYVISFVQDGQEVIKRYVKQGEKLEEKDIPVPISVDGYDVVWENADFENVFANMTINAIITPKSYTITLNANGGELEKTSQTIKYGSVYNLEVPTRENYTFVGWNYGENSFDQNGKWNVANDVTLTAVWLEKQVDTFSIIFVQSGEPLIIKTLKVGERLALEDIPPVTITQTCFKFFWEKTDEEIMEIADDCIIGVRREGDYTSNY